jgi:small subunit ribosomal protein S5
MTEKETTEQGRSEKPEKAQRNQKPRKESAVGHDASQQGEFAEIKEVLISVNRTTKVVKGGRRFSFAAVVIVGDGQGRVGYGLGKAKEILDARGKASQAAKKNMIKVQLKDNRTVFHDVTGKYGSGHVILRSAKVGTGIIAGGPMRAVFEMLGAHDIVAKSIGSSNVHNIVGATFDALKNLCSPAYIRNKRAVEIKV